MRICVTIAHPDCQTTADACRQAVDQGADLVELRLDHLQETPDWGVLLADRRRPIVATCRRPEDGGLYAGDETSRRHLLVDAAEAGVDWVDLEVDVFSAVPIAAGARRIVSLHDLHGTPTDIAERAAAMQAMGADMVKLVTFATRLTDVPTMLQLCAAGPVPTVAFCMGQIGQVSRLLVGRAGAPWTYSAPDEGPPPAAGQLSLAALRGRFAYATIDAQTALFAVAGDPIEHSLSPHAHNAGFANLGLNARYLSLRVPAADLEQLLPVADALGLSGLSITLPHKRALLGLLKDVEPLTRRVGACNTLVRQAGGWRASNTDLPAALATARRLLTLDEDASMEGRRALILGAGGVARALAMGLLDAGAKVTLAARDDGRRRNLARDLGCAEVPWSERHGVAFDLLLNGTPVGMEPHVQASPFDAERIPATAAVFDTIYNPQHTALCQRASARGCKVAGGVDMFIAQAAVQFERFTARQAPEAVMRRAVVEALAPERMPP